MKERSNSFDRTGSSQDFSNNEGFHNYQDFTNRNFENPPHFADRNRSQYDDGMNRSERNDYRTDSDYRAQSQQNSYEPRWQGSYAPSQNRSEWNRPSRNQERGSDYGTGSTYRGSSSQRPRSDYSYSSDASMMGSDLPRTYESHYSGQYGSQYGTGSNYGAGSYQSERFDQGRGVGYNSSYQAPPLYQGSDSSRFGQQAYDFGQSHAQSYVPQYGSNYGRNESRYQGSQGGLYQGSSSSQGSNAGDFSWQSDRTREGSHYGKGPKGYKRSDERIQEDVSEALRRHSEIDASEIEVDVKDGLVTLSGTVESRQIKRMAEDCAAGISGVSDVKDDLRIMSSADASSKSRSSLSDTTTDSEIQPRSSSTKGQTRPGQTTSSTSSTSSNKSVQ
jgi:osmotically-inducible protein OsmY